MNAQGEAVKIELSQQNQAIVEQMGEQTGAFMKAELQAVKADLLVIATQSGESLKIQQMALEKCFAKAGQMCVGIVAKLHEKLGTGKVIGINITEDEAVFTTE